MRSRSIVAVCSSSGLATSIVTMIAAAAPVTMREARCTRRSMASAATTMRPRRPLALAVAGRPGGDGQPVEVEQRLVGHVDGERRREARRHHREEDQQRPGDPGVPAEHRRDGAAGEDREAADDPHGAHLVVVDRQGAADAGDHGGRDAGGAEDGREEVDARLVERRERRGGGERRCGGRPLPGVATERQHAGERAGEQHPDRDGAHDVVARATGVPRGEGRRPAAATQAIIAARAGLSGAFLAAWRRVTRRGRCTLVVATSTSPGSMPASPSGTAALSRSPRAVCSSGMPGTSACLAYSRATSTAVAPAGTTRSSTPAGPWMLSAMVARALLDIATSDTDPPFASARNKHHFAGE